MADKKPPKDPKTMQVMIIAFGYTYKPHGKTLLLKTPHTLLQDTAVRPELM